ncbi:MAG: VWA domain-containing protein [Spirochaetota bacterium]|nr:VWA domain-containing protein [Spirochaetota bacterium]
MMFTLAYPLFLLLLLIVALWSVLKYWKGNSTLSYSLTKRLIKLTGEYSHIIGRLPLIMRTISLVLLVFALARPQLYNVSKDIRSSGVDIMLCLDTSGSMRAYDFKLNDERVTRLVAVKKVVTDFIKKREHDRIGLVVFGQEAFTQSPLTMDKGLLLNLVEGMEIGMAGDSTALGSAIAIGGKRLKDLKAKSKILILLTDGRNNAGEISPEQAADALRAFGVKIYSIGVGGKGPAPFKVETFLGTRFVNQSVDLDEKTLQKVASIGGGQYFRAADSEELSGIYDIIDKAEKTEIDVKEFFHFQELYLYFLIPALIIIGLEIFLKATFLRVIP